jgi:HEAT repeat protein
MLLLLYVRHRRSIQLQGDEILQDDEFLEEETISTKHARRNKKLNVPSRGPNQRRNSQPGKLASLNASSSLEMHAVELTLDGPLPAQINSSPTFTATLFSAERIKQEVSMLVKNLPYGFEVLSSRAPDDRRLIEASLVEAANAPDLTEDDRERARHALEEHGFVVRRGSVLLSAPAAAERASAARTLAEMHSPASMPFLLEALYDVEATVRMEAINSLGALKTPSAIGALMDVAFRHPETSVSILSDVLKSCSFEDFESFETPSDLFPIPDDGKGNLAEESKRTALVSEIGDLPESDDDPDLADALSQLEAEDTDVRAMAARVLGQFPVKRSVRSLTSLALNDESAAVRAAAVASLGDINHESVFAHLLIAFSDESREVQAAAARSLSSLSIDRTEAYALLLEISDEETLRDVARACSQTGMVSQAVDKLVSPDRRQSHEAFLLLSLLAKVNETDAIKTAVEGCNNSNARLAAMGLFGLTDLLKLEPAGAAL